MRAFSVSKENENNRQFFQQMLFTAAMVVLAIKNITDSSVIIQKPGMIDNLLIMAFTAFIGIKLMTQKYTYFSLVFSIILFMVSVYTCIKCYYFYLYFTSLLLCAIQDVDFQKVLNVTWKVKAFLLGIHVLAYATDAVIQPWKLTYSYRDGVQRMTFYQGHANTFAMYLCWISLEYLYSSFERLTYLNIGIVWLINFFFYQFCDSNTAMITVTFACILILCCKVLHGSRKEIFEKIITVVSKYLYAFLSIFFVSIIIGYVNGLFVPVFEFFDDLFTGRLLYGAVAYDLKGISFFGKSFSFDSKTYWRGHWVDGMIFDNCFIWMMISYGIVYLVLISLGCIIFNSKMTVRDKIFILLYTMYTVMEAYVMNAAICFPLLILGIHMTRHVEKENRAYDYIAKRRELLKHKKEIIINGTEN